MLQRQVLLRLEEEPSFGTPATTRFTNPVDLFVTAQQFSVTPSLTASRLLFAEGSRVSSRKVQTAKAFSFSLGPIEFDPVIAPWFMKWAGSFINPTTNQFQWKVLPLNQKLKSFTLYADTQVENFFANTELPTSGGRTLMMKGCVITEMTLTFDGQADDRRGMLTVGGFVLKPNVDSLDRILGVPGFEPVRSTLYNSAALSAFNFKDAITNWDSGGYVASNDWKRFSFNVTYGIKPLVFSDESGDLFISDFVVMTCSAAAEFDKEYVDAQLTHDAYNAIDRDLKVRLTHRKERDGSANKYQQIWAFPRFNLDDAGDLIDGAGGEGTNERTYVGEALRPEGATDVDNTSATGTNHSLNLIDEIAGSDWTVGADAVRTNPYLAAAAPDGSFTAYRIDAANAANPYVRFDVTVGSSIQNRTFYLAIWAKTTPGETSEALIRVRVTDTAAATVYLDSDTLALGADWPSQPQVFSFTPGTTDTDFRVWINETPSAANDFMLWNVAVFENIWHSMKITAVNGGYLDKIVLKTRANAYGALGNITPQLHANNGGSVGALLPGGTAEAINGKGHTTTYQRVPIYFPDAPLLAAAGVYHLVIPMINGLGALTVDGDTGGSATHRTSSDGVTWSGSDTEDWNYEVITDRSPFIVDVYSDKTYPDAS